MSAATGRCREDEIVANVETEEFLNRKNVEKEQRKIEQEKKEKENREKKDKEKRKEEEKRKYEEKRKEEEKVTLLEKALEKVSGWIDTCSCKCAEARSSGNVLQCF